MRLVCDRCGARFHIADDLVRGKPVKVRCRRCGATLEALPPTVARTYRRRRQPTRPPPLPAERAEWFLVVGEGYHGPMGLTELRHRVQRGEANGVDLVWREGLDDWEAIGSLAELRIALDASPMVQRTFPPALQASPPRAAIVEPSGVIGGEVAATGPAPRQAPAQPRHPAPLARQQTQPMARWPVLTLVASGLALVAAVVVVIFGRGRPEPAPILATPVEFVAPRRPGPEGVPGPHRHGPMEIHARRGRAPRGPAEARPPAPDAAQEPTPAPLQKDFTVAAAAQIHRRNRGALAACDGLAERRGEHLDGTRARFTVRVSAEGEVDTTVTGEGISASLLLCYRSVASQFQAPAIGRRYSVIFSHVH